LEATVDLIKKDVDSKEFKDHLDGLRHLVAESHQTLMAGLPHSLHSGKRTHFFCPRPRGNANMTPVVQGSSPRFGFFVFIVIASQVMLLGSYMIYRRRIDTQPKKYL
jgi:mannose-binding lectin 1